MFVTRLHDRLGETQYIDALTGEKKVTSMWLRNEGGHNRSRDTSGQLSTQANRYVMQLGGDIAQWSNNGMDRFHMGVMAGYGNSKNTTVSQVSGYNAKGTTDGYSTGVYGTYMLTMPINRACMWTAGHNTAGSTTRLKATFSERRVQIQRGDGIC